jgi:site-specific DNA recombinase
MERIIREIEKSESVIPKKLRVAAYARVSSGKEAMLHSLSMQVSYYSKFIQNRPDWEYMGIYSDEAYTGTKASRPGFQQMLADCRAGKIDMVITKSISRFARNTVTMLEVVRELKAINVNIFFEKENIHSISGDGEFMLTILASFAQEESRSVSENCKWRIRKQFQDGKPSALRFFYGYNCEKGALTVKPEEAAVVRMIFDDYIGGMGKNAIMKKLNAAGIKTRNGNAWGESAIYCILHNEKYAGNLLLQKTFRSDHITKKKCVNRGELPMYYAEGTHEAIISQEMYDKVQLIKEQRAQQFNTTKMKVSYPFTGKIRCGICGKSYQRRSLGGGRAYAWRCATFNTQGKAVCASKQIPENTLLAVSAQVIGIKEFDEIIFRNQIDYILVPGANLLTFVFYDGNMVDATWEDRSRRESWTEEKRQQARLQFQKGVC